MSISGLQSSIVGLYGGGVGGPQAQETFPGGTLPTDFTSVATTLAAHTALYNVATAQGDAQAAVGIWPSAPPPGRLHARILLLRGNAALTSFSYLKDSGSTVELGCFVGGVQTVFATAVPQLGGPPEGAIAFRPNSPYTLFCRRRI